MQQSYKTLFSISSFKQSGQALLLFFVVLILASIAFSFSVIDSNNVKVNRDKNTAIALAKAKAVLLSHVLAGGTFPGSLPCPSTTATYDGVANSLVGNNCPTYIGWFPWKSLNSDDLHDGDSERLWYVLSPTYRDHISGQPLNYDTVSTLNVDGRANIAAIIFSPGASLAQSRPSNNAIDYLEGTNNDGDISYSETPSGTSNDKLITISHDEVMNFAGARVAQDVLACLNDYNRNSIPNDGDGNLDRHPWTTNLAATYPNFADSAGRRFGRVPDSFNNTRASSSNLMSASWSVIAGSCKPITNGWWTSWKEFVFYAVAYDKDPNNVSSPNCTNDCLTINTPSGPRSDIKVAVIVSGKAINTQVRGNNAQKQDKTNYLEGDNATLTSGTDPEGEDHRFVRGPNTLNFNDVVAFY